MKCLTVSRLAEDPHLNIGIIEAGAYHKDDQIIDIPGIKCNVVT